jgi:hypothetical protein
MKQRATALTDSRMIDQLCDLLIPKLEERLANHMPSKQRVEGSNPSRDSTKSSVATPSMKGRATLSPPCNQAAATGSFLAAILMLPCAVLTVILDAGLSPTFPSTRLPIPPDALSPNSV